MTLNDLIQRWSSGSPEQVFSWASDRLPFWVSLLLVVGIGYQLSRIFWLAMPAGEPAQWTPPPFGGAARAQGAAGRSDDYSAIVNAHLFGKAAPNGAPIDGSKVEAPETNLNLQLKATVAAGDSKYSHAIINDGAGGEKVYFLKGTVPGGATLQSIQPDRVILSRGGALEALLLPREGAPPGTAPRLPPVATTLGRPAPGSMQEAITQNANTITQVIRPQPYMPNGELKGYRVYPGRNREQFVALGLQPGDLVTEINGMSLNNPQQAMQIFKALGETTQAQVMVERDGKSQTLTLDTSQVAAAGGATQ
jgi:general secretion pathway protein C